MPKGIYPGNKGKVLSKEHKRKTSFTLKGRKHSKEHNRKVSEAQKGARGNNWKGGRRKAGGYIFIWQLNHPFATKCGYVKEHRLVMEQHLRKTQPNHSALVEIDGIRYLHPKWVVHHINNIRSDNRIENLKLFSSQKEHQKFHCSKS